MALARREYASSCSGLLRSSLIAPVALAHAMWFVSTGRRSERPRTYMDTGRKPLRIFYANRRVYLGRARSHARC